MAHLEDSIEVDRPIRTVYNQWTQFEQFPSFMEGVKQVQQLDDRRLIWNAEIAGKDVEWTAEITTQEPDAKIGWRSTSGASHAGLVAFSPVGLDKTKVTLRLEYEPEGAAQKAGSALGFVKARVHGDLKRFKEFIEEQVQETGAWRGQIGDKPGSSSGRAGTAGA